MLHLKVWYFNQEENRRERDEKFPLITQANESRPGKIGAAAEAATATIVQLESTSYTAYSSVVSSQKSTIPLLKGCLCRNKIRLTTCFLPTERARGKYIFEISTRSLEPEFGIYGFLDFSKLDHSSNLVDLHDRQFISFFSFNIFLKSLYTSQLNHLIP